ncbi:hypothetical protein E2562_029016 [Oryza meyeriana var. granulata]|uniref:F-box domain-containing protein n=1 Tax=Oryza meyeriana var. granulata TaxID=110450 RepID=A0A6G1E2B5_9ORYZ|nr:hypothetical protein E2562_029016 [Oryza meyeriana var. granulata]
MSFRSIVRDVRDGFGSLSRRSFEVTLASLYGLTGHHKGKTQSSLDELHDSPAILPESRWASLPPELLREVIRRLEADESTWPSRRNVVCFAAVCRTWREILVLETVSYELNVLGTRGPRRMRCIMHSIPASSVEPGGIVPGQPEQIIPRALEDSFRSTTSSSQSFRSTTSFSKSIMDPSMDFNSARFSDINGSIMGGDDNGEIKERPLVLRNKPPRWHEQLQCWCLNFRGRVTIASVKNFQLVAAPSPHPAGAPTPSQPGPADPEKIHQKITVLVSSGEC